MSSLTTQTIRVLDCYEGRDGAITLTLYFCCLLSGFYPTDSNLHLSLQRIFERLEDCRVVLRLYDDIAILRDFFTYELRPGERNWIVRCLKLLHYIAWLGYYPSEHISWLGDMNLIEVDPEFWEFLTNFFWATALITSALWNAYVVLQYRSQKHISKEKKEEEKKSLIPWTAARNAMLVTIRDGTEFMVAVNNLPKGYLWSSTLTYTQVGMFGTCSAFLRLFALFKFAS
ncbi:unnamed protein product [Rotaria socialis]|uniref:Uncharacterized protein n=1 Tax=Rotaria socialis TaxID=392032 RepID=A0A817ZFG3_9BILA|nr:unnamed protein product [Rotaria socialis]CAF3456118.1 unnamed protein product [Rotaria socialis]CAF4365348.1 unnamed protein product [Rotaria socialis]CAF4787547.1 unnamed protein product [Rotaria socialis]